MQKNEEELGRKGFLKENLRSERSSSAFISALYKKDILTVLREQIFSNPSGSFYFTSDDVPLEITHSVLTKHSQLKEKGSGKSDRVRT